MRDRDKTLRVIWDRPRRGNTCRPMYTMHSRPKGRNQGGVLREGAASLLPPAVYFPNSVREERSPGRQMAVLHFKSSDWPRYVA